MRLNRLYADDIILSSALIAISQMQVPAARIQPSTGKLIMTMNPVNIAAQELKTTIRRITVSGVRSVE